MRTFRLMLLSVALLACSATAEQYTIHYDVSVTPERGEAAVTITLRGDSLPSRIEVHFDPDQHRDWRAEPALDIDDDVATWRPRASGDSLSYRFAINHKRDGDSYDAMITDDWAVLRSDKLVPPMAVKVAKGLQASAELDFDLPEGWSSAAPYESLSDADNRYRVTDPGRRFIRPKGWLILGSIASRQDVIADVGVRVAAPRGQDIRLQDALAFVNWTLPYLKEIFPDFPPRLLIVSADDPMWRGGLSGPNSLFMHGDRPLISGNRTSSLIHELVHVGTSIRGTDKSDWIVEGIAEYYAVEILRRSGGISELRFRETLDELAQWGKESDGLFTGRSSGATTARAVGVMRQLDRELRELSEGKKSLDDVATALAEDGGKISVKAFVDTAERLAGGDLESLADIKSRITAN
ncbi:hypothetical protein [Parahaliea mediterranea]|uniref:Peptidase M61 catalytic domain-containing protein n=1 Tax=Parahaliea mediterranea TaxID=651086 RepID=A0A939DEV7_9GAMM|nr:hypothetical protein [Parahaliea mediterranea]MBN7796212.1 hypothetical protein [Parahaliea mediterranea]